MKQIDWSEAPDWANVLLKHVTDDSYVWAASYKDEAQASHVSGRYVCFWLNTPCWVVVESRPEPQWSGKGLPPVGKFCEFYCEHGSWVGELINGAPVEILAHYSQKADSDKVAVFAFASKHGRRVSQAVASCFRPFRTPEQIAAEEREAAISEMAECANGMYFPNRYLLGDLYDAGYRKPNA